MSTGLMKPDFVQQLCDEAACELERAYNCGLLSLGEAVRMILYKLFKAEEYWNALPWYRQKDDFTTRRALREILNVRREMALYQKLMRGAA